MSHTVGAADISACPCPTLSVDCAVRGYSAAVALGVTVDLAYSAYKVYTVTNPVAFIATEFAKACVYKFADHLLDITAHTYRAVITKDSSWYAKAGGVILDVVRIANIVNNLRSTPYTSSVPVSASRLDLLNHVASLGGTAYNELCKPKRE